MAGWMETSLDCVGNLEALQRNIGLMTWAGYTRKEIIKRFPFMYMTPHDVPTLLFSRAAMEEIDYWRELEKRLFESRNLNESR